MDKEKLIPSPLCSGFTGKAANDALSEVSGDEDRLPPHQQLQQILKSDMQGFMRDFRQSLRAVLDDINLTFSMTEETGLPIPQDETARASYMEIEISRPFQKNLWLLVVESYHDHLLRHDQDRFCAIYESVGKEALEFFLRTGRPDPAHTDQIAAVFSSAYLDEPGPFSIVRDMMRQNIPEADIGMEMRELEDGWAVPVIVMEAKGAGDDLRLLLGRYLDGSRKRPMGLHPV